MPARADGRRQRVGAVAGVAPDAERRTVGDDDEIAPAVAVDVGGDDAAHPSGRRIGRAADERADAGRGHAVARAHAGGAGHRQVTRRGGVGAGHERHGVERVARRCRRGGEVRARAVRLTGVERNVDM